MKRTVTNLIVNKYQKRKYEINNRIIENNR